MRQSIVPRSVQRFDLALRNYVEFSVRVLRSRGDDGTYPVPDEDELILFATWLAEIRDLSPKVIKQRLRAVGVWCTQQGAADPRLDGRHLRPRLYDTLRGIARTRSTVKRIREALTTDKLRRFLRAMLRWGKWSEYDEALYTALLTIGVFGLFRVGELTSPTTTTFDRDEALRFSDITLGADDVGDEFLDVRLRASKTDVCRRGVTIRMYATGQRDLCPVAAFRRFARRRTKLGFSRDSPAFCKATGKFVTRDDVSKAIKTLARLAGYDPTHFVTHSMRAGGATTMAQLGYDASIIKLFGRWRSDCFTEYIKIAPSTRKGVAAKMAEMDEIDAARRRRLWLEFRRGS
jgi:hypothetical protein